MILSMDILLLTNIELENRIQEEFTSNPALEIVERKPESQDPQAAALPVSSAPSDLARQEAEIFAQLEAFQNLPSFGGSFDRPVRSRGDSEDRFEALSNVASKPDGLREYLIQQIHLLDLPSEVVSIAENIINNLDHRGYLLSPPEEVLRSLEAKEEDFQRAFAAVRSLDPAGVGATDLKDCLILQLERDRQDYGLETQIIRNHLEDLRQNKIPKIAKELGKTIEEIKDAREIIGLLQPAPGSRYEYAPPMHVK